MSEATRQELQESINQLTAYRHRLIREVINMAQKLKLPQTKIDSTIMVHPELKLLDKILTQLKAQLGKEDKS